MEKWMKKKTNLNQISKKKIKIFNIYEYKIRMKANSEEMKRKLSQKFMKCLEWMFE